MSTNAPGDPSRHFSTDHLKTDLKGRSVRAGAVTVAAQVSRFVINLGSTAVLARILTPDDFGLIAMLFAVTAFVEMFRDMGLSSATIQRKDIDQSQVSALFWTNVAFSGLVSSLIILAAPWIAAYYGREELTNVGRVIGLTFFLGGLNAQHTALLARQMRFAPQAIVTVCAMFVGAIASIIAAYKGMGYWSLVIGQVALAGASTIGIWSVSGWMPGRPRWDPSVGPMLKYGFNLAGFGFINTFARSFDSVLIGSNLGATQAGLYSKAYQFVLLPIQQINTPLSRVAMPALSRLQSDPAQYRRFFINAVGVTTFIGMPIVALLFVAANEAILLQFGPQWTESVPLFRLLAPAAFFGTFNVATGWVYASLGHTHRQLKWGVVTSICSVTGFLLAIKLGYGAKGVAAAFSIVYCGVTMGIPGFWFCFRGTSLRLADAWEAIWRPAITSIAAAGGTWAFAHYVDLPPNPGLSLLLQGIVYGVMYIAAWLALPNGRERLVGVLSLVKSLKKNPGAAKPVTVELKTDATTVQSPVTV